MRIAHVVNLFQSPPGSRPAIAQAVTCETMLAAQAAAAPDVEVSLYAAQLLADREMVPAGFQRTPELTRTAMDIASFSHPRPLPLIADILEALNAVAAADYFIYTNNDIALQPHFYSAVAELIAAGHDAFVITKRIVPEAYFARPDIRRMQAEVGKPHAGHDCFVFRREALPHYWLGETLVGAPGIGQILLWNLVLWARRPAEYFHKQLTFHIGTDRPWLAPRYRDYADHNWRQLHLFVDRLEESEGARLTPKHTLFPYMYRMRHRLDGRLGNSYPLTFRLRIELESKVRRLRWRLSHRGLTSARPTKRIQGI